MTREEAIKQIDGILEYFEDRIERETDPAFDKEIAKKDAEALRMAIQALEGESRKENGGVLSEDEMRNLLNELNGYSRCYSRRGEQ